MASSLDRRESGNSYAHEHSTNFPEKNESGLDLEQPEPAEGKKVDVPPNGGYGWVCVACSFWINAHTWGINSAGPSSALLQP